MEVWVIFKFLSVSTENTDLQLVSLGTQLTLPFDNTVLLPQLACNILETESVAMKTCSLIL